MRIVIVGGHGTIGRAVAEKIKGRHDIIIAARQHGDVEVDITDLASIEAMYKKSGKIDAIVSTTGKVHFAPLSSFTAEEWALGLNNKLLGQVQLVTMGIPYLNDGGSFTLTSGIINRDPIRLGASAAMVNGAIDAFVKAAAIELPRGLRINAISPTVLEESMSDYADFFSGFVPVPAEKVACAYVKSIEGAQTGQVYCVN